MFSEARMIGHELLKTGTLVSFRILEEEVATGPDEAEFSLRLELKFVPEDEDDKQDEDYAAENTAEWGAFGFMFVIGLLSFAEAKPREASVIEYVERDEFKVSDFLERLRFRSRRTAFRRRLHPRAPDQNLRSRALERHSHAAHDRPRQGSPALARTASGKEHHADYRAVKRSGPRREAAREESATIWTLKVKLEFGLNAKGPWQATIEIDSTSTLEDLHLAIQHAVDFDNDHMYAFYVSRTARSRRDCVWFDDENGGIYDTPLASLFPLPQDRKLYYWFDFGDDWLFNISKSRMGPQEPAKDRKYPRLVEAVGKRPVQYPPWE